MIAYIASMVLVLVGIYTLITKDNLIKKVMGLIIITNGTNLFLISLGYRSSGIPPIMSFFNPEIFSLVSVDPLPQALVLTSIVINLSITALAVALITRVYKTFGTVNAKRLKVLKG